MDKKTILTGIAKYYRMGSKGNRTKLIIDDAELSKHVKEEIENSVASHKIDGKKPALSVQDFLRGKKIEVRLV